MNLILTDKLTKQIEDDMLYPIFFETLETPFVTSDIRQKMIIKFQEVCPNVPAIQLKTSLARMERRHFENLEVMDRNGLRNKIIQQQGVLNEMAINHLNSGEIQLDKVARVITESNKLTANVAGLSELPPSVEIVIQTNAPSDLALRMNKQVVIDQNPASEE